MRPETLYLSNPAFTDILREELGGRRAREIMPGVVAHPKPGLEDPCFARQVLPRAVRARGTGPSGLADAVLSALEEADARALYEGRARLDVLVPDFFRKGSSAPVPHPLAPFAHSVGEALSGKAAGRARKRGIERSEGPFRLLVQVLVVERDTAFVSAAPFPRGPALTAWPSRFPGGRAEVPVCDAPSSAYKKLDEALAWLEEGPKEGDVVLDLGAAPGGWTFVMVELGVRVLAFDRARLDPRLERSPLVEHIREDAFAKAPLDEATWLCCDIIDEPRKTLDLVRRALESPRLGGLVVTVKLKRPIDLCALIQARRIATTTPGYLGRVKNLAHNKLEVTLMMRREPASSPSP